MFGRLESISKQLQERQENRIIQYRNLHPLNRNELRDIIYGRKYREIIDQSFDVMIKNNHVFKHSHIEDFNRAEEREQIRKMIKIWHKQRPVSALDVQKDHHALNTTMHSTYQYDPGFSVRSDITLALYGKTILYFNNPQNKVHRQFLHNALSHKDIGCFGLTQIGHGSDAKNLQTQAIYDHSQKVFTLNSPKQSSYKFWIGGAANTANMAIIWAQLIIKGVKNGIHPFVVPLRNRQTKQILDGVILGDCGSKMGLNSIDNGYIGFKNYKIPCANLLDKISGVDQNGNFRAIQKNLDKRHGQYMGPLSLGRAFIMINSPSLTSNALLIGLKYCCVRRQFEKHKSTQESLLIDYPLVRFRLMPQIATNYIYIFAGYEVLKAYGDKIHEILSPKSKIANLLHAISAVGKVKSSWNSSETIGNMRHLLAGHGYSGYSRLGSFYVDQQVNTTWQGDNHMLLQQVVKYLLKNVQRIKSSPQQSNLLNFVNKQIQLPSKYTKESLKSIDLLQQIMKKRFMNIYDKTISYMIELKSQNLSSKEIWDAFQPYYGKKMSLIFGDIYYLSVARSKIQMMTGHIRQITQNCIRLWLFNVLQKEKWQSQQTRAILQQLILQFCDWLTPRSISLLESLAAPEQIIGSPFADKDGDKMWSKYINLLYGGKDAFSRISNYQDIIDGRQKQA